PHLISTIPTYFCHLLFFFTLRPPPRPTLFPYTTLFRSIAAHDRGRRHHLGVEQRPARDEPQEVPVVAIGPVHHRRDGESSVCSVDRKSTRLNSSHVKISYAVFCLKKKNKYNVQFSRRSA